jgi:branched-chain amino acid transport system substrate-binding protein
MNKFALPVLAAILLAAGARTTLAQIPPPQPVRIGVSGPLSGPNAFAGKDDENGVRLAVEELNARKATAGGKPLRFEVVSEDDGGDPKSGVQVAQKFADAGVRFVLGPYNSGVAIPAARVYHDAGILMSTVGTSPRITQSAYPNVFRIVASDAQVGASMAAYAAKVLKLRSVGVIDDRSAFGQGIADEFARRARAAGVTVAGREFTSDKASDFATILTTLRAKKVDAVFFGGYAPQAAPMARQMKQLGMANARLLGGDTLCSPEMARLGGDAVGANVLCAQAGAMLERQAGGAAFRTRYRQRFGREPDVYAAAFYDQTMFIAHAIEQGGTPDAAAVGKALHTLRFAGVAGNYAYDAAGNLKETAVTVYTFDKGRLTPLAAY